MSNDYGGGMSGFSATAQRIESQLEQLTEAVKTLILVEERQSVQAVQIEETREAVKKAESELLEMKLQMERWQSRGMAVVTIIAVLWTVLNSPIAGKILGVPQ